MIKYIFSLIVLSISSLVSAQELVKQANALMLVEQSMVKEQLSSRDRAKTIAQAFINAGFEKIEADKPGLSTDDLDRLFAAQFLAIYYTNDSAQLRKMEESFSELVRRDKVERKHVRMLYEHFIKMRRFDGASALASKYPGFNLIIPPMIESKPDFARDARAIWIIDKTKRRLTREAVQFSKGWELVVIAHPLCHFSNMSLDYIRNDETIAKILKGRLKLISPQDGQLNFDELQEGNVDNLPPIHPVDQQAAFTEFDEWATPTFYFMKSGKVVHKFSGWPKEGNREQLNAGLQRVGARNGGAP
jgi:hypothetical protein